MDSKDFFKSVYDDFFGIEKLERENQKLREELHLTDDFPTIELEKEEGENSPLNNIGEEKTYTEEELKKIKDDKMAKFFEKIEKLYLTEESKNTLKKIVEYTRKFNEKIEKQFIAFNMCIYSDNKETTYGVIDLLSDVMAYFNYIKRGDTVEASLYNVDKTEQLEEIYTSKNAVVVIKDVEAIISQDQRFKDQFWHKVEEKQVGESNKYLTIIINKTKEAVNSAFDKNENIKDEIFRFELIGTNPDVQEVYQEILEKLKENNEISEEFEIKLLDYISITYPKTTSSYPEYRDKLCEHILFHKTDKLDIEAIPSYEKDKSIEEVFVELNELVGLQKVKQVLQDLVSLIELKRKTEGTLKLQNTNLHMVFLGNPGTGKTTVARMVAEILYQLKYIRQNKLVEVSSKDLVAEYVGQTGPKTMAVVEKAMGGVLFIDEAYTLASGNGQGNSFNEEAIGTLIQAMENHRDDLVVIFAGYTKEMQNFLNANSGIVSRIGYTLEFEDYTESELLQIFENMTKKAGFEITKEAKEEVLKIIKEYKNTQNFGNARFVRNVYEKTIIKHAANTRDKNGKKALKTIGKDDISVENLLKM